MAIFVVAEELILSDGDQRCMNLTIDEENSAALWAVLDSALEQLDDQRFHVENGIEKLVDKEMRAGFESTVLKNRLGRSREYYKIGATELNAVIDQLHEAHNGLAKDHRILQRKYAVATFERESWLVQVEVRFYE
ncbi:hypothetical protein FRC03_009007 [Tulasnella sp. 419]|nr:hypothetical protein FRC03_009007 [Tulasnella sp. 419]